MEVRFSSSTPSEFAADMEVLFERVEKVPTALDEPDLGIRNSKWDLPFVEFIEWTQFRGNDLDERVAKEQTWKRFNYLIDKYLKDKTPDMALYWRIVPEDDLSYTSDKNWKKYSVYARFAVVSG